MKICFIRKVLPDTKWELALDCFGFAEIWIEIKQDCLVTWRGIVIDTPARRYHTGWNGERFAANGDMEALIKRFPGASLKLAKYLRKAKP